MIYYAIDNLLADEDTLISASSEDSLYIIENLFNRRPSKPFRFTGDGAVGSPEWLCIELLNPAQVTLASIFNHNLSLGSSGDDVVLKACDGGCGSASGDCDWDSPDYGESLSDRIVANHNDLYKTLDQTRLSFRFEFIDSANPDGYVEIGELFLGSYVPLLNAHLSPGRKESPEFFRFKNETPYGQIWSESLSYNLTLELTIKNVGSPSQVDDLRKMLLAIHANSGVFVIIPNHRFPFAHYVFLENERGFASQLVGGLTCKLDEYTLTLRTLTKGISLL